MCSDSRLDWADPKLFTIVFENNTANMLCLHYISTWTTQCLVMSYERGLYTGVGWLKRICQSVGCERPMGDLAISFSDAEALNLAVTSVLVLLYLVWPGSSVVI